MRFRDCLRGTHQAVVVGIITCGLALACGRGGDQPIGGATTTALGSKTSVPAVTATTGGTTTTAAPVGQGPCPIDYTRVLSKTGTAWTLSWTEIRTHLSTVTFVPGQQGHVLKPTGSQPVRASIASNSVTPTMLEAQAVNALRCGHVLARIVSTGNHTASKIRADTNFLIIWRAPPTAANGQFRFVIINPKHDTRETLPTFKYTPHVTAAPVSAVAQTIRSAAGPTRPLSSEALSCEAQGWKSCFVVGGAPYTKTGGGGLYHGLGSSGLAMPPGVSQPWVPCPLYGCCCGGEECHSGGG
jgi:hypothetical protein